MNSAKCLECDLCKMILDKPVSLPCGHTLCYHHLENTNEYKVSCMFCFEEHQIPKNGFQISEKLSFMIDFYIELNPLRKQIKETFNKLNDLIRDYEKINSDSFVYDYFAEIFNKVDLHREELLKEINERYEEIINMLKEKQQKCKLNINNVEKVNLNELKNEIIPSCQFKLRNPDINVDELNEISSKMSQNLENIQKGTKKLKKDLLLGELIEFEKHDKNSSFGQLILKNSDLVLSNDCGNLIRTFPNQHTRRINSFQVDEHSRKLISASIDKTIKIWDLETGECLKTLHDHKASIETMLIIPNNKFISASVDYTIKIWDLITYECLNTITNESQVHSLCLLPNNETAFGCRDGSIQIWNLNSLNKVKSFEAHNYWISYLLLLADKTKLISCSGEKDIKIKIWHLETFECVKVLDGHSSDINCIELNSNDNLLSCSEDRTIKLWQIETGQLLKSIKFDQIVNNIKSLNQDLISIALENGNIQIYNYHKMEIVKTIQAHSSYVYRLYYLSNDGHLVSGSEDGEIKMWTIFE